MNLDNDKNVEHNNNQTDIPPDFPLTNINLPCPWVLYLYDKQLYKKIVNRPNFQAKPHKELCTISTVNDLIYILQLLEVKIGPNPKLDPNADKINLDVNDYIIMRKGIEPIWEDPKNLNGGTFTIKMAHSKGYDVWSLFMMYMLGETLTQEMGDINGMTVSYISDTRNAYDTDNNINVNSSRDNYTYIKIWDSKQDRTIDQFVNILPSDLLEKIKTESLMYSQHNKKKNFNDKNIISKLHNNSYTKSYRRDSFNNYHKRR